MTHVTRRAYVLHSGGLDSSTALAVACHRLEAEIDVISVSVNYGQRHLVETGYAKKLCECLGIEHMAVDMARPPKSMLTNKAEAVPNVSYDEIQGMSPTYVPFRNGQLLSRIAGIAQAWVMEGKEQILENQGVGVVEELIRLHGSSAVSLLPDGKVQLDEDREATVWFGAHAEDAHNWAYPDCTPEFVGAMANAIYIGTYHKVRLVTPFIHSLKSDIVRYGDELALPFELTWSCYVGGDKHCGICPTCRARKEAFIQAAVRDPTVYAA